jgi:hypothetical protein
MTSIMQTAAALGRIPEAVQTTKTIHGQSNSMTHKNPRRLARFLPPLPLRISVVNSSFSPPFRAFSPLLAAYGLLRSKSPLAPKQQIFAPKQHILAPKQVTSCSGARGMLLKSVKLAAFCQKSRPGAVIC